MCRILYDHNIFKSSWWNKFFIREQWDSSGGNWCQLLWTKIEKPFVRFVAKTAQCMTWPKDRVYDMSEKVPHTRLCDNLILMRSYECTHNMYNARYKYIQYCVHKLYNYILLLYDDIKWWSEDPQGCLSIPCKSNLFTVIPSISNRVTIWSQVSYTSVSFVLI